MKDINELKQELAEAKAARAKLQAQATRWEEYDATVRELRSVNNDISKLRRTIADKGEKPEA